MTIMDDFLKRSGCIKVAEVKVEILLPWHFCPFDFEYAENQNCDGSRAACEKCWNREVKR